MIFASDPTIDAIANLSPAGQAAAFVTLLIGFLSTTLLIGFLCYHRMKRD